MCLFLLRQLFLIQHLVLMLVAKIYFLCYLTASKLHIQKRFQLHFSVKILYKSNQNYLQFFLTANEMHFICGGNNAGTNNIKMRQAIQINPGEQFRQLLLNPPI